MIPLIIVTSLFSVYIQQQHFRVAEFLPARTCQREDLRHGSDFDFSFLDGAYRQPELQDRYLLPEPCPGQDLPRILVEDEDDFIYLTPNQSAEEDFPVGDADEEAGSYPQNGSDVDDGSVKDVQALFAELGKIFGP